MTTLVAPRMPSLALLAWFALAGALALAGVVVRIGPPLGPLGILGGVGLGLLAHARSSGVRAWTRAIPLRGLILFQALRAPIGAAFLVLAAACVPTRTPLRRRLVLLWNLAGLLDILLVVATAQYLIIGLGRADMLAAFTDMPAMAMLPLFVVPAVILAHLAVFLRLRASAPTIT